jgi:FixJ family two-component response regulator
MSPLSAAPPSPDAVFLDGTVHVVDDDASFRTALERRLRIAGYTVRIYRSAEFLLNDTPNHNGVGCILLDVRLPGLSGPELQERLSERGSTLPILFLSGYPDIPTIVTTIKAGAEDFLTKPIKSEELLRAVKRAITHHGTSLELKAKVDVLYTRLSTLSPRQRQVFGLVVRGKQNKQIAHQLAATERTIKAHRREVMERMQVRTLAELVATAERLGIVSDRSPDTIDQCSASEVSIIAPCVPFACPPRMLKI